MLNTEEVTSEDGSLVLCENERTIMNLEGLDFMERIERVMAEQSDKINALEQGQNRQGEDLRKINQIIRTRFLGTFIRDVLEEDVNIKHIHSGNRLAHHGDLDMDACFFGDSTFAVNHPQLLDGFKKLYGLTATAAFTLVQRGPDFASYRYLLTRIATVYADSELEKPEGFHKIRTIVLSWMQSDEKMIGCNQEPEYATVVAWRTKTPSA